MLALKGEDREAIREVMARYCWHTDHGDWDAWLGLFTADGAWGAEGARPFEGQEALAKLVKGLAKKRETAAPSRHFIANEWIEAGPDSATLRAYAAIIVPGSGVVRTVGEYEASLILTPGGWRLRRLHFRPIVLETSAASPAGVAS
jgi:uncharacterized protein (TIGR02246 family)